jgi:hypothetical protein
MRDVTDTLRAIGYQGPGPVMVEGGYVVSPVRQFWPSFYHNVKVDHLMANIEPGRTVRYDDPSLRSNGSAEVLSVNGKYAKVRWQHSGITSTEHIPSLELVESQEVAA